MGVNLKEEWSNGHHAKGKKFRCDSGEKGLRNQGKTRRWSGR